MLPAPDDALADNRSGALTPDQRRQVMARLGPRLAGGLVSGLIMLPFLFCFGGSLLPLASQEDSPLLLIVILVVLAVVVVAVGVWAIRVALGAGLALLDVNGGRVLQADGRLRWMGRDYRGVTDGPTLRQLPGAELMPGGYRFFYLPRSRYIISAERLSLGSSDVDALDELRRALADEFNFVDEDLIDNQAGQLSARQRWAVLAAHLRTAALLGPFFLLALAFMLLFPFLYLGLPLLKGQSVEAEAWIGALLAGGMGLLFTVLLGATLLTPVLDVLGGEVRQLQGLVDKQIITTGSGRSRSTNYYYVVDGQRFRVNTSAYNALIEARPYRLFYLPRSKRLVNVEALRA